MRPISRTGRSWGPGVVYFAITALVQPAYAQTLPRVHVIATGGTIASSRTGSLGVDQLLEGVPQLRTVAELSFEQALSTGSSRIVPGDWLVLARAVGDAFRDPGLAGIVLTHGTDSMEETAYFLDLVVGDERPVVVTGAMRSADAVGADGPANLLNAVRLAAHPEGRRRGTLVLMNDRIHEARRVTKTNTLRVDAFVSPGSGPIGVVDADGPHFTEPPAVRPPRFDLAGVSALPSVAVDYAYVGAEGVGLYEARRRGADGVVIASFGSGRVSAGQAEEARAALEQGLVVVMSSRVGSGRVLDEYGGGLGTNGRGIVLAEDLNPQKARVLLVVALTRTRELGELADIFRRY